uniref:Uncharacterized protein n=1 Tax=Kalanchoe fedtschenkoi TaxID=63787 RepID=A0A7N1A5Y3_KALFE
MTSAAVICIIEKTSGTDLTSAIHFARDNAGVLQLEGSLDHGEQVERFAREGEVNVGVAVGLIERIGRDQHGRVAPVDEAVTWTKVEGARGGRDLFRGDGFNHDLLLFWARFGIVGGGEF